MDKNSLEKLCNARDVLCGFCEAYECEKCIVTHLVNDAYNEVDEESFTAFIYEEDGVTTEDLSTYDNKDEAIEFAKRRGWDEVVNDCTGEIVWHR